MGRKRPRGWTKVAIRAEGRAFTLRKTVCDSETAARVYVDRTAGLIPGVESRKRFERTGA